MTIRYSTARRSNSGQRHNREEGTPPGAAQMPVSGRSCISSLAVAITSAYPTSFSLQKARTVAEASPSTQPRYPVRRITVARNSPVSSAACTFLPSTAGSSGVGTMPKGVHRSATAAALAALLTLLIVPVARAKTGTFGTSPGRTLTATEIGCSYHRGGLRGGHTGTRHRRRCRRLPCRLEMDVPLSRAVPEESLPEELVNRHP